MLNSKNAKLLGRNQTIDLKYMMNRDYCDSVELKTTKDKVTNYWYIVLHYLGMFTLAFIISFAIFFMFFAKSNASYNPEFAYYWVDNYQDYARKIRIEACTRVYEQNKEFVDKTFIHTTQNVVTRCATFTTLIKAYESWYWKSNMCESNFNCFWIKDWNTWKFKVYNSEYEWYLDFARLYLVWNWTMDWKWHKNRTITEFVRNWSWDSEEVENRYINFVTSKYWEIYKEINLLK